MMRSDFWGLPYSARKAIQDGERAARRGSGDAAYWRNAYETLVKQTGRDLNDGLGLDPRKTASPSKGPTND